MKHVIILHASKRNQCTYGLLQQIQERLRAQDIRSEIVPLYDLQINDCIGCERCITKGACVLSDDVAPLLERLAAADGVILSSPVYLQQVSGKMKTFIDRTCCWFHRPPLCAKPLLAVATTKGSGLKDTLSYLQSLAPQWGAMPAGCIGRTMRTLSTPVSDAELATFVRLLYQPHTHRPKLQQLILFEVQKSLALMLGGLDAAYWQQQNWQDAPYYFRCQTGWFKPLISGSIGKAMRKEMRKSATAPQ